jgi:hypothetical protein
VTTDEELNAVFVKGGLGPEYKKLLNASVVEFKFVVCRPGVAVDQWHLRPRRPVYSPIYTAWDDPIMARKFGGIILLDVMHKRPDE